MSIISSSGGSLAPSWLLMKLKTRFGVDLAAVHFGADLIEAGGLITSWPGRVGATMINLGVSQFSLGSRGSYRSATLAASSNACLQADNSVGAAVRTCMAVATTPTIVWPTYGSSVLLNCGTGASGTSMQVQNGQEAFYTGSFWSHYVDGIASEDPLPDGTHVFEGTTPVAYADTKYCKTGDAGGAWGWVGPREFLLQISRQITAGERADTVLDIQRYHGLLP
jgi:hypothetical protein